VIPDFFFSLEKKSLMVFSLIGPPSSDTKSRVQSGLAIVGERLSKNLVEDSLLRAVSSRKPEKEVLHHSDRDSQYCSHEYRSLLKRFGLVVSMSGRGNCYDNAPMESFWGILKQELVHHCHYHTRREAMAEIREYIEVFYNWQRLQAGLGYLSPTAFMQKYYLGLVAA
jgi:transposase InsO family protein